MTTPNRTESFQDPLPLLQKSGTWLIVTAIGLILVGTLAVIEPLIAGLTLVMLVGWLLLIGGVIHGISAFEAAASGT